MTGKKTVLALVLLLMGSIVAESAFARHRGPRISLGFGFGAPYYAYPYYAPYPYYYYPRYYPGPVVVERAPVYVEQGPAAAPAPAQPQSSQVQPATPSGSWYYCNESGAYYPYVQECAGGWQRVAPQP